MYLKQVCICIARLIHCSPHNTNQLHGSIALRRDHRIYTNQACPHHARHESSVSAACPSRSKHVRSVPLTKQACLKPARHEASVSEACACHEASVSEARPSRSACLESSVPGACLSWSKHVTSIPVTQQACLKHAHHSKRVRSVFFWSRYSLKTGIRYISYSGHVDSDIRQTRKSGKVERL